MEFLVGAVDIGFAHSGIVIIDYDKVRAVRVITTKPDKTKQAVRCADDDVRRCQEMYRGVRQMLFADYKIKAMVVELPSSGAKGARAIGCMARAQGLVSALAVERDLPTEWVPPSHVKLATCNSRNASKEEVEQAVLKLYPELNDLLIDVKNAEREHVCDAVGAWHAARTGQLGCMIRSRWTDAQPTKDTL